MSRCLMVWAALLLTLSSTIVSAAPGDDGHAIRDGDLIATSGAGSCADYCVVVERHGRNLVHVVYVKGAVEQVLNVPLPAASVRWTSVSYALGSESRSFSIDSEAAFQLATQDVHTLDEVYPHPPSAPPAVPPNYTGTVTASVSYVSGNYMITVTTTYTVVNGVIEGANVTYTYRKINILQSEN